MKRSHTVSFVALCFALGCPPEPEGPANGMPTPQLGGPQPKKSGGKNKKGGSKTKKGGLGAHIGGPAPQTTLGTAGAYDLPPGTPAQTPPLPAGLPTLPWDGVWTVQSAIAPLMAAMDDDLDTLVTMPEWGRRQYAGPHFDLVDKSGDGALDASELLGILASTDPLFFEGHAPRKASAKFLERVQEFSPWLVSAAASQHRYEWLCFQRAELLSKDAAIQLPTEIELRAAFTLSADDFQKDPAIVSMKKALIASGTKWLL